MNKIHRKTKEPNKGPKQYSLDTKNHKNNSVIESSVFLVTEAPLIKSPSKKYNEISHDPSFFVFEGITKMNMVYLI